MIELSAESLVVWRTEIEGISDGLILPFGERPNPCAWGEFLLVSLSWPGNICCLSLESGRIVWRRSLSGICGASVTVSEGIVYAKTAQTLFALSVQTGALIWEFTPRHEPGEHLYSYPVINDGMLFIGDRFGQMYCLDARTGSTVWQKSIKSGELNTTAVLWDGKLAVGSTSGQVDALEQGAGEFVWQQNLGAGPTRELGLFDHKVAVCTDSLFVLDPLNGAVAEKYEWTDMAVRSATIVPASAFLLLRSRAVPLDSEGDPDCSIVTITSSSVSTPRSFPVLSSFVGRDSSADFVYVGGIDELWLLRSDLGIPTYRIRFSDQWRQIGIPDRVGEFLYVVDDKGTTCALKWPPLTGAT